VADSDAARLDDVHRLLSAGRPEAAVSLLDQVLERRPNEVRALWMRAEINIRRGRFEAARSDLEAALSIDPGQPGILHALGGACHALGEHEAAESHLRQAIAANPQDARLWYSLGLVYHGAGRYQAALDAYDHALAVDPAMSIARLGQGKVWQVLGRLEAATAAFEAVLADEPGNPEAVAGLAEQEAMTGRSQAALARLDALAGGAPLPDELKLLRARLLRHAGDAEGAAAALRELLPRVVEAPRRASLLFDLGHALDELGHYDAAFAAFEEANSLKAGSFDAGTHAQRMNTIARSWDRDACRRLAEGGDASVRPIFIVGIPRSGTSLVEQILAAHPEIHGCGELNAIGSLARSREDDQGVVQPAGLSQAWLREAAEFYLEEASPPDGVSLFTDKMPANLHHLGLIQAIFPLARVIHCVRDPLDTGLSCFFQDFSALGLSWAQRLEDIAAYQRSCAELMVHWHSVLDLPICTLEYEKLVDRSEEETRRIVDFLGLGWDAACLAYHRGERPVLTASHNQAIRPIHARSVGRHHAYGKYLAALAAAKPMVEK